MLGFPVSASYSGLPQWGQCRAMWTLARPRTGGGIAVCAVGRVGPPAAGQLGTDGLGDSSATWAWDTISYYPEMHPFATVSSSILGSTGQGAAADWGRCYFSQPGSALAGVFCPGQGSPGQQGHWHSQCLEKDHWDDYGIRSNPDVLG